MGHRFKIARTERIPGAHYTSIWAKAGTGRFWKRLLSKARRRAWKQYGIEGKVNTRYESECHYKNW